MPSYKLTNSEKIIFWKDIILAVLKSRDTQAVSAEEFLEMYPHAELPILQQAIQQLVAEGKVQQI